MIVSLDGETGTGRWVVRGCSSLAATLVVMVMLVGGCSGLPQEILDQASRSSPKDFLLGPEDVLEVTVWRNQDLSKQVVIRPDGMISLPLIGDVHASGLTAAQVADRIARRLAEFKENPAVSVSVREVNSYYIYVMGEVTRPGKYQLKSYTTVLQGVSLGGGFTPFASKGKMSLVRIIKKENGEERQLRIPVPYDDLVSGKGLIGNLTLISGDTIVVP